MMKNNEEGRVIIGIDPGTRVCGYGIVRFHNGAIQPLDYGCIRPPASYKLSDRYLVIHDGVEELIDKHQATELVVETQYLPNVKINVQSLLKLGMARGIVLIAAKRKGLPVFAYEPTVAKKAVVGNGRASKEQVQRMVQNILMLSSIPEPEDAADALALAICHTRRSLCHENHNEM
jgi:crossover junction endodeoxyribonuclease RuvC